MAMILWMSLLNSILLKPLEDKVIEAYKFNLDASAPYPPDEDEPVSNHLYIGHVKIYDGSHYNI